MPARDRYHDTVKQALVKDGWTITHDPLRLQYGRKDMYVDLGAERLLGAEKGDQKIAVEIKSFLGTSDLTELERAVGQYVLYQDVMRELLPDRELYLAVRKETLVEVFEDDVGKLVLAKQRLRLIVFDEFKAEIIKWMT
jgi:hypothetical protein